MSERTEFAVYRWDDEDLTFVRRIQVQHVAPGVAVPGYVLAAITAELHDFGAGLYRAIPVVEWVDFGVESKVVLA